MPPPHLPAYDGAYCSRTCASTCPGGDIAGSFSEGRSLGLLLEACRAEERRNTVNACTKGPDLRWRVIQRNWTAKDMGQRHNVKVAQELPCRLGLLNRLLDLALHTLLEAGTARQPPLPMMLPRARRPRCRRPATGACR